MGRLPPAENRHPPALPDLAAIAARVTAAQLRGSGIRPSLLPVTSDSEQRWLRTNVRPQKQAGYSIAIVTIPLGFVTLMVVSLLTRPRRAAA